MEISTQWCSLYTDCQLRLMNLLNSFGILCMNGRLIDRIIKSLYHKVENPADFLPLTLFMSLQ